MLYSTSAITLNIVCTMENINITIFVKIKTPPIHDIELQIQSSVFALTYHTHISQAMQVSTITSLQRKYYGDNAIFTLVWPLIHTSLAEFCRILSSEVLLLHSEVNALLWLMVLVSVLISEHKPVKTYLHCINSSHIKTQFSQLEVLLF